MLSTPRRALVVGGTSGIGHGIALALAARGAQVTIAGRSEARGQQIVKELEEIAPHQKHSFEQVDGFRLESMKDLAERQKDGLDILVMTQGMATMQGYTPTVDGLDQKLQLHYFSRIYLARLLLPKLMESSTSTSSPPRILSVLSAGVHSKYNKFEEDFELKRNYSIANAADAAGFYNDAGFEKLALENPGVVVVHAAPGLVNTNWGTEFPWAIRVGLVRPLQQLFGTSLQDCGQRLTSGLLDNMTEPGFHLMDQKGGIITDEKAIKHTSQERDIIWTKTLQVLPDL